MNAAISLERYHRRRGEKASSGDRGARHGLRTRLELALGPALADQQQTDALQQFGWFVRALGQENVGQSVALVDLDPSGDQHSRSLRREALDSLDQAGAIDAGHDQIGQDQVDAAAAEGLERLLAVVADDDAVAARLQQDFADRKGLFVVINAQNGD